jgi:hypothetical protein
MATRCLLIRDPMSPLFHLRSTFLFRQLHDLEIDFFHCHEITIFPCLEQIKRLEIWHGIIPTYSLDIDLPLFRTLQWLRLRYSTFSWMLGRTFKALREFRVADLLDAREVQSRDKPLQVNLPVCTNLRFGNLSEIPFHFFSCPMYKSFDGSNIHCDLRLMRQFSSHYVISYAIFPVCESLSFSFTRILGYVPYFVSSFVMHWNRVYGDISRVRR